MTTKKIWTSRLSLTLIYLFIGGMTVFTLMPFLWPVTVAFSPPPGTLYVQKPAYLTLENFREAISGRGESLLLMRNSLFYAGTSVAIVALVCSLGGYTLSRMKFRLKRALMYAILLLYVIPVTATVLPYYLLMHRLKLVDTYVGIILGLATGQIPFMLWVMKGFFDTVPMELEEAAWVDGANRWQALFRVVLPLSLPGLGAGVVLAFSFVWAAFFLPMILLSSPEKFPLSLGLFRAIVAYTYVDYGLMNAIALIYMAPSFLFFLFARRYLIRGVMGAALAGN